MKRLLTIIVLLLAGLAIYIFREPIVENIINIIIPKEILIIPDTNKYKKSDNFLFLNNTDDFTPTSNKNIYDIFFTTINSGWSEFTFYCEKAEYEECITDVNTLGNNAVNLSQINNYIHPFNSYKFIETVTDTLGKVTIKVTRTYNKDKLEELEKEVDEIYYNIITEDMSDREAVLALHDYIINNTKYDIEYSESSISNYESNTAYGSLVQGYAVCGGYTDAMALFLEKLDIKNYKIASATHIWNFIYLEEKWYHLDLTWDDPVINNSRENRLQHEFFLITTKELEDIDTGQHDFDENIYLEAK